MSVYQTHGKVCKKTHGKGLKEMVAQDCWPGGVEALRLSMERAPCDEILLPRTVGIRQSIMLENFRAVASGNWRE